MIWRDSTSLRQYGIPISVDESLQNPANAREIIDKAAADIFSIKISKNGGLLRGLEIGKAVEADNKQVMMNSMIELGITQSASLHLGTVLQIWFLLGTPTCRR